MFPFFLARGVTKSYAGREIIADINLHVEHGELVSLLGISGVGKTTLFHVLSGLEPPDQGEVWLKGEEITATPGKVGYMQQKDLLLPFKRVVDNLALPLVLKGIPSPQARRRAEELLPIFGLEGTSWLYPAELSGGMRQRAALLRTFLFSGEMLLLDEPFSALDTITKSSLHGWFNHIRRELKLSTLFVTHDLDEALQLSDRIYILSGSPGKLVAEYTIAFTAPHDSELSFTPEYLAQKREIARVLAGKTPQDPAIL